MAAREATIRAIPVRPPHPHAPDRRVRAMISMMWSGVGNWPRQRTVRPAGGMRAALTIALAAAALLIAAPLSVATAQTSRCEIPEVATAASSPAATEETAPTPVGAAISRPRWPPRFPPLPTRSKP
jgi:hypothetical protein